MPRDPYTEWLDIPPGERPPDAYTLLGLTAFEPDPAAIAAAADRRVAQVRERAPFDRVTAMRALVSEILSARNRLLDPGRKDVYDYRLRETVSVARTAVPLPPAPDWPPPVPKLPETHDPSNRAIGGRTRQAHQGHVTADPGRARSPEQAPRRWPAVASFGAAVLVVSLALNVAWFNWSGPSSGSESPAADPVGHPVIGGISPASSPSPDAVAEPAPAGGRIDLAPDGGIRNDAARPEEGVAEAGGAPGGGSPDVRIAQAALQVPPASETPERNDGADEPVEAPVVAEAAEPAELAPNTVRPLPTFSRESDAAAFSQHLREMLYDGFRLGRAGFPSAGRHFEAARRISDREPRLDYGYALILWKNLKYDEAAARLRAASGMAAEPYWPVWQTRVRLALARKTVDAALTDVGEFARILQAHAASKETGREEHAAADWIGRLVGYLELPENEITRDAKGVAACDAEILAALSGSLRESYEQGKSTLRAEFSAMQNSTEGSLADLRDQQEGEKGRELEAIAQEREKNADRGESLTMSAEKWKEWVDAETQRCDAQLVALTRAHQELASQARVLAASIARLNEQIAAAELGEFDPSGYRSPGGQLRPDEEQLLAQRIFARDQLASQYSVLETRAAAVMSQGRDVAAARQSAVARFEQATGQLVEQGDALRRWNQALAAREREAKRKTVVATPKGRSLLRQARALDTYLPFDPEVERQRILDSLPPTPSRAAE